MCLVTFAWMAHPDYRLVLAANRDEFHARPAAPMEWWPESPQLLAGRDLEAGGTWLGISRNGRFATVTNYREDLQRRHTGRSRGELVTGFLQSDAAPRPWCESIELRDFAGFSLLAMADGEMATCSNRGDTPRVLPPGVYGLSNASLDTPWCKVRRSKAALSALLRDGTGAPDAEALFRLLGDCEPAAGDDYAGTGLPPELARAVSAPFIATPDYGTRCSTVLLLSMRGAVEVRERRFDSAGQACGDSAFGFRID